MDVAKELRANLAVLAEIERRHSAALRRRIEPKGANGSYVGKLDAESARLHQRTERNLAEITDKLNRLIGYVDGDASC